MAAWSAEEWFPYAGYMIAGETLLYSWGATQDDCEAGFAMVDVDGGYENYFYSDTQYSGVMLAVANANTCFASPSEFECTLADCHQFIHIDEH